MLIYLQCPEYNVRNVPEQEHAGKSIEGAQKPPRNNEEVVEVICVEVHFLATLEFMRQIHCQGVETCS